MQAVVRSDFTYKLHIQRENDQEFWMTNRDRQIPDMGLPSARRSLCDQRGHVTPMKPVLLP